MAEVASAVITLEQSTPGANHAIVGRIDLVPGAAIPADAVIAVIVWAVVATAVSVGRAERRGGDRVRSSNRGAGHVGRIVGAGICRSGCSVMSVMTHMLARVEELPVSLLVTSLAAAGTAKADTTSAVVPRIVNLFIP